MGGYSRARPAAHWLDYPDTTYGVVGSAEFGRWDTEIYSLATETFRAADYGVVADGTADDRTALEACVTDATAAITAGFGATVTLPKGVIYLNTASATVPSGYTGAKLGIGLPVNLAGPLIIRGQGHATRFKLSANCKNVFWINKQADYDTFQNVVFEDFDVDNNSATGRCHILIGNMPENVTRQTRLNYADVTVQRVDFFNVPVDPTNSTSNKYGVCFVGQHVNSQQDGTAGTALSMEATQTSSRRIWVRDSIQYGGSGHATVASWLNTASYQATGPTNHFYDQIYFHRLKHILPSAPTATISQTSYYLCAAGIGEYGEIVDCYSENIGDDAIECGGMQHLVIDRFRAKDPFLTGILNRQSQTPRDVNSQKLVVRDAHVRVTSALAASTSSWGIPVRTICDNGVRFGTVEQDRVSLEIDGAVFSVTGRRHLFAEIIADVQRIVMRSPKLTVSNYTFDASGSTDIACIYIAPPTVDITTIDIDDFDVRIEGFSHSGAGGVQFHCIQVEGSRPRVSIDGIASDLSGVNATGGTAALLTVGKGAGGTIRCIARRLMPRASGTGGGMYGVRLFSTAGVDQLVITESNLGSATGLTVDIDTSSAGSNATALRLSGNRYLSTITKTTITLSGSPFSWQNATGRMQAVTVTGGTVSKVEWGDSASTFTDTGLTAGIFPVDVGQSLRVSYTVAPTMTALPANG